jgi:putative MATE family efflux protein
MAKDLTTGDYRKTLISFALPFLMANMLQALYGATDLFVVGRYEHASAIAAVNIGSQIMQMISGFIIGCSVATTVLLGRSIGASDREGEKTALAATIKFFAFFACIATPLMLLLSAVAVRWMQTPADACKEALTYVRICALGIPFITIFNVISAVFRSYGDSRTPMNIVLVACITNIAGDFLLTGFFRFGTAGVAAATVAAQGISSVLGLRVLHRQEIHFSASREEIKQSSVKSLAAVGLPIAMQDTLINVSFMVLTVIANQRGLIASSAVGITEKIIGFMFLVPSAMLSALTAVTSQNMGAGKKDRALKSLKFGILITVAFGILMCLLANTMPSLFTGIFTADHQIILQADEYFRTYSIDCILVGFTFCINGYLCGIGKSSVTFMHNVISIFTVRIPCAWLLSTLYPSTMSPMGLASPLGSLMSMLVLCIWYHSERRKQTLSAS